MAYAAELRLWLLALDYTPDHVATMTIPEMEDMRKRRLAMLHGAEYEPREKEKSKKKKGAVMKTSGAGMSQMFARAKRK